MAVQVPKKRDFRQRAHVNPLSDRLIPYPLSNDDIDWHELYPALANPEHVFEDKTPSILDIGCAYGGLSFALSDLFPTKLILGLEIRFVVTTFTQKKIEAKQGEGSSFNVAVQWANTMRTLMRYVPPHSVERIFIAFPDPHFKARKVKWRVVSRHLADEYAFIMKSNGLIYIVTDVRDYYEYAKQVLEDHPLFAPVSDVEQDVALNLALTVTEEARKVTRNGGDKFFAVFRRL